MKLMLSSFERYKLTFHIELSMLVGDDGREVTPVPIPNTEVKLSSADGSWDLVPVRVGRRQAKNTSLLTCVFLCLFLYTRVKIIA